MMTGDRPTAAGRAAEDDHSTREEEWVIGIQHRHWRPGDDEQVMRILGPTGWCTPDYYATKLDDAGLRPEDILIAEQEGRVVGHLMLPQRRLLFDDVSLPFGGIGMVVVDPATRGHGVGARLLDSALARHRALGNTLAGLFTKPSLAPAYEMYRRRGFTPVTRRVTLAVPVAALPSTPLQARPAQAADEPAIWRLYASWARQHRGMGSDLMPPPTATPWVVDRGAGEIIGAFFVAERPEGRLASRFLVVPTTPAPEILAAALNAGAIEARDERVPVITNTGNRLQVELAPLASREEPSESVLMIALLRLAPLLAGLSLDLSRRLRATEAAAFAITLALDLTGERVHLTWGNQVLAITDPPADAGPPITLPAEQLILGLMGQAADPPMPVLAPLWVALCPAHHIEMNFINCW